MNAISKCAIAVALLTVSAGSSEARRSLQPDPVAPPPPTTNPVIVPAPAPVQAMSARVTLLNGVFYSKYALAER